MKVSICIPAYKHVSFLKRCLDSILEQDFHDFEVVITDDSPDDALEKLVDSYQDNRIRYFKNEKALGSPTNWNEGIRKAQGEYIKILHHDDWFASKDSLAAYVGLLDNHPDADIAFSGCCDINVNGAKRIHRATDTFLDKVRKHPETLYMGNAFGAPSVSIFRNHKDFFFDPSLIWLVDTDFYIRVIKAGGFAFTPELLVNIGVSEFQITQQCLSDIKIPMAEKILLFKKFGLKNKSSKYRHSLLRLLGRQKILSRSDVKKILPDTDFTLSAWDIPWLYYFYTRRKLWEIYWWFYKKTDAYKYYQ